jgi:hypothetical protein
MTQKKMDTLFLQVGFGVWAETKTSKKYILLRIFYEESKVKQGL